MAVCQQDARLARSSPAGISARIWLMKSAAVRYRCLCHDEAAITARALRFRARSRILGQQFAGIGFGHLQIVTLKGELGPIVEQLLDQRVRAGPVRSVHRAD